MPARSPGELAELRRQGAKAAVRGDAPDSNPMLHAPNLPGSTGESERFWSQRRDAWRQGYEFQRATDAARRGGTRHAC